MLFISFFLIQLVTSSDLRAIPYGHISSAETLFPRPTPTALSTNERNHTATTQVPDAPVHPSKVFESLSSNDLAQKEGPQKIFVRQDGSDHSGESENEDPPDGGFTDESSDSDGDTSEADDPLHSGDEAMDDPTKDTNDADDEQEQGGDNDDSSDDDGEDDSRQIDDDTEDLSSEDSAAEESDDPGDPDFQTPSEDTEDSDNEEAEPEVVTTLSRRPWKMDCLASPGACRNACFYTNCVRGTRGDTDNNIYRVGMVSNKIGMKHRKNSGVTTDRGRPCSTGPFGQKFWDQDRLSASPDATKSDTKFQTDEWPMAAFLRENSDRSLPVSLRCIPAPDNEAAGASLLNFYGRGSNRLDAGTKFRVDFDFSRFDRSNAEEEKIYNLLDVCRDTRDGGWSQQEADRKCKNDGRNFHLEHYRGGRLWPLYDHKYHNSYRIDGEEDVIQQYFVKLVITSEKTDSEHEVEALISRYKSPGANKPKDGGEFLSLAKGAKTMKVDDTLTIKGNLPRELKIKKRCDGNKFIFVYGDPQENVVRWFEFDSEFEGYKPHSVTKEENGKYCVTEKEENVKRTKGENKGKDVLQTTLKCSFPGW